MTHQPNALLDPTHEQSPAARQPAARLDDLSGRVIGFLDISKPRGDVFLDELHGQFEALGARVERFTKPTFTKNAPIDLRQEIAEKCDAVVEALAD